MPGPITEDSRDDELQGSIFEESALSPSESKWNPIEFGIESGSCSGHASFYPRHRLERLDPVGVLATLPAPELSALPIYPSSSPRPPILSSRDLSANDSGSSVSLTRSVYHRL